MPLYPGALLSRGLPHDLQAREFGAATGAFRATGVESAQRILLLDAGEVRHADHVPVRAGALTVVHQEIARRAPDPQFDRTALTRKIL